MLMLMTDGKYMQAYTLMSRGNVERNEYDK